MTGLTTVIKQLLQLRLLTQNRFACLTFLQGAVYLVKYFPKSIYFIAISTFKHKKGFLCNSRRLVILLSNCTAGRREDLILLPYRSLTASRNALTLLAFCIAFLKSSLPLLRLMPTHCRPNLIILMILSTGFLQEGFGAVLPTARRSRSKFKKRAINNSCTEKMSACGQGLHQYREREYSCSRSALE